MDRSRSALLLAGQRRSFKRNRVQDSIDEQRRTAEKLRWGSTWKLVGLSVITLGVYTGYFALSRGRALNILLSSDRLISERFLLVVFNLQIAAAALFFPFVLVEEGHWIEPLSDATDLASGIAFIFWGFSTRSRMNEVLGFGSGFFVRLSGLWTFLFSPFYFNYKINQLCEPRPIDAV